MGEAIAIRKPVWTDPTRKRGLVESLRLGSAQGVADTFLGAGAALAPGVLELAAYVVELRRENVATIGSADAFVRRTETGELRQVIAPVTLSLGDGTLYQLPERNEKRHRDNPDVVWDWRNDKKVPYVWRAVIKNPDQATVSAEGYLRMNAVAGCSVQLPPTVMVDGNGRSNPCVNRDAEGDVDRIVIDVYVAGPAPLTGNLVVVQYRLDLNPQIDLLHMLSAVMKGKGRQWQRGGGNSDADADDAMDADREDAGAGAAVVLMSRDDYNEFRAELEPRERRKWAWKRMQGSIGLAHNLANAAVKAAYDKYLGIVDNAVKKAQTVARRNAMKAHPALARHTVHLAAGQDTVVVPVTGWTSTGADLDRYTRALDALARGQQAPGVEVLARTDTYDPATDATGDPELDPANVEEDGEATPATSAPATGDTLRRNELLRELEELLVLDAFTTAMVGELGYPPAPGATVDELSNMLARARGMVDDAAR